MDPQCAYSHGIVVRLVRGRALPILDRYDSKVKDLIRPFNCGKETFHYVPRGLVLAIMRLRNDLKDVASNAIGVRRRFAIRLKRFQVTYMELRIFVCPIAHNASGLRQAVTLRTFLCNACELRYE